MLLITGAATPVYAETIEELQQTADELAAEAAELQETADAAAAERSALESRLSEANTQLWTIIAELEEAEAALLRTMDEIDATEVSITELETSIDTTKAELASAQKLMGDRMAANYKGRTLSLISMVLGSTNFEEFVNNIYLATKVTQADAKAIEAVKDIKAALEQEQLELELTLAEKEELLVRQQDEQVVLEQREQAQRRYVSSLDDDVREALLAEQTAEAEANRAAAEEAAARAQVDEAKRIAEEEAAQAAAEEAARKQAEEAAQKAAEAARTEAPSSTTSVSQDEQTIQQTTSFEDFSSDGAHAGHGRLTDAQRSVIIATAWDRLNAGCRYRSTWGGPDYFGCAGFTQYCYAVAGVSLPRSPDWQQELFTMCPASELLPGDLVFWYNHVAIYAGDGMIIEATSYTGGIRYIQNYAGSGNLYYYGGGYLP